MKLQDQLNALKAKFESAAPQKTLQIMHRATDDLRNSGILEQALNVGDKMPHFSLKNVDGQWVHAEALLSRGPLILSFYRGKW